MHMINAKYTCYVFIFKIAPCSMKLYPKFQVCSPSEIMCEQTKKKLRLINKIITN